MSDTIKRKIYFYRVDAGYEESGKPIPFNPIPTFTHINSLDFSQSGKYWKDTDKLICCWVDSLDMPCKISLGNIRRDELPDIENRGEITPLEIPAESGLVEQTYIVFLDDNIVGCDFNFYGPRITRLPYYLAEKAVGIAPEWMNFNPLLRQDVYNQLKKFDYLKIFDLKIRASYAEKISQIDKHLGASFEAALEAGDSDILELILQPAKLRKDKGKGWLKHRLLETTMRLAQQPDLQYETEKFVVHGHVPDNRKMVELDLLSDKLIITKEIYRTQSRSRTLNKNHAYYQIISAYNEIKEEIREAASIGP